MGVKRIRMHIQVYETIIKKALQDFKQEVPEHTRKHESK